MAHSDAEENHFFESDKTSGVLIFLIDNCDPVKVKFSETIRVQVIFDHIISNSDICDNHEKSYENISDLDKQVLRSKDDSVSDVKDNVPQIKFGSKSGSPTPLVLGLDSERGHDDMNTSSKVKLQQILDLGRQQNQNSHEEENCSYDDSDLMVADKEENDLNSSPPLNIKIQKKRRTRGSSTCKQGREGKDKESKGLHDGMNDFMQENPIKRRLRSSQRLKTESFESKEVKTIKRVRKQERTENSHARTPKKQKSTERQRMKTDFKYRITTNISSLVNKLETKEKDKEKWKKGIDSKEQMTDQNVIRQKSENQESWKMRIEFKAGLKGASIIEKHSMQDETDVNLPLADEADEGCRDNGDDQRPRLRKKRNRPRKLLLEKNVRCVYCGVTFETKFDFFNHRRVKGADYTCDICGKKEPFEGFLIVHRQSHKPEKGHMGEEENENLRKVSRKRFKMKCDICGTVVSSLDSLKIHTMLHTGEYPYRCCVCDDQHFYSLSSLRYHLRIHLSAMRVRCKPCNMSFTTRAELARHQLTHEIKCGLCGEIFPNKTSRNCHYSEVHQDEILKCAVCFNLFATEAELQKHMLYHSKGKREQCPECGVVVVKLKDHMTLHTRKEGEKMYACDQCSMRYKTKPALDKHFLKHTGEKPYACNKCAKRFRDHGLLRKHLLTHHTLERRFVCDVCGKSCKLRSNLAIHMKQHTNNRQYSCTFCSQAFNYKNSLKLHIKAKHSNQTESLLKCLHCSQTFQDNALLTSHILAQHPGANVQENSRTCLPQLMSFPQETSIMPVEPSPLPFISEHVQAYASTSSMDPNFHGALDMTHTIDMSSIEAGASLFNNRTTNPHINSTLVSTNLESIARGELLNYVGRDRNTPLGHPTPVLSVPPPLHLLPLPSMDLQHSNPVNCLPPAQLLHSNTNNGHMESSMPMSTKDLQDSSPLDEQVHHPVYHNL